MVTCLILKRHNVDDADAAAAISWASSAKATLRAVGALLRATSTRVPLAKSSILLNGPFFWRVLRSGLIHSVDVIEICAVVSPSSFQFPSFTVSQFRRRTFDLRWLRRSLSAERFDLLSLGSTLSVRTLTLGRDRSTFDVGRFDLRSLRPSLRAGRFDLSSLLLIHSQASPSQTRRSPAG